MRIFVLLACHFIFLLLFSKLTLHLHLVYSDQLYLVFFCSSLSLEMPWLVDETSLAILEQTDKAHPKRGYRPAPMMELACVGEGVWAARLNMEGEAVRQGTPTSNQEGRRSNESA